MSTQELIELDPAALAAIAGGAGFADTARGWFNWVFHEAVNLPTSVVGGWQLAGQMYGDKATLSDRVRAMRAVHGVLAASPTMPAWAHRR